VALGAVPFLLLWGRADEVAPRAEEVLLRENFDGDKLDPAKWELAGGRATFHDGVAALWLDAGPKGALKTTQISTKSTFEPGASGIEIEARLRLVHPDTKEFPKGLCGAFYAIAPAKPQAEFDFELLTNDQSKLWLNTWSEGQQFPQWKTIEKFDQTQWNTYILRWKSDYSVEWLVNGKSERALSASLLGGVLKRFLPASPMRVDLSLWRPGKETDWTEAYNADFDRTLNDPDKTTRFALEVDYLVVRRLAD